MAIDQPGSIAQLVLAVCASQGIPVAYVPGLVVRRAADLYPGESRTDRRTPTWIATGSWVGTVSGFWRTHAGDVEITDLNALIPGPQEAIRG